MTALRRQPEQEKLHRVISGFDTEAAIYNGATIPKSPGANAKLADNFHDLTQLGRILQNTAKLLFTAVNESMVHRRDAQLQQRFNTGEGAARPMCCSAPTTRPVRITACSATPLADGAPYSLAAKISSRFSLAGN
jgi:hypothetical protein